MKFSAGIMNDWEFRSHPARGAWIEIVAALKAASEAKSHPARGAWIEILTTTRKTEQRIVAPRKWCVD